jgi:MFS family permease
MQRQDDTTPEIEENSAHEQIERTITKRTPLPKFQLFIVLLVQFAEPITGTVIYPFINQFVRETGVTGGDERKTGYFAGIIVSIRPHSNLYRHGNSLVRRSPHFFIAEALTVFHWGRASDRYGRRRVLLLGPLGLSIAMATFGLSRTFWLLVVSRCFQGVFNGNIGEYIEFSRSIVF